VQQYRKWKTHLEGPGSHSAFVIFLNHGVVKAWVHWEDHFPHCVCFCLNFNFKPTCKTDHTQVVWKGKRVFKTVFWSSDIFGMLAALFMMHDLTKRKNVFKIYRKIFKVFLWNWSIAISFLCVMFNVNLCQFHSFEGKLQEFEMSFGHCSLSLTSFCNIKELMCDLPEDHLIIHQTIHVCRACDSIYILILAEQILELPFSIFVSIPDIIMKLIYICNICWLIKLHSWQTTLRVLDFISY